MRDQLVDFFERSRVEEQLDALAGRQFSGGVLLLDACLAAPQLGAAREVRQNLVGRHPRP
jgi:hypothetical protein